MAVLVVPGVRVEARFDVLPPLPAASGVVGVAAIVDRPSDGLVGVTKAGELAEVLGPGTAVSAPEVVHLLANGAQEVVVSAVAGGAPASVKLTNRNSQDVVVLKARSNGAWANDLAADVQAVTDDDGNPVRATLRLLLANQEVERFADLVVDPGGPTDLFTVVNDRSRYVVALDPGAEGKIPRAGSYALGGPDRVFVPDTGGDSLFELTPEPGVSPAGVSVVIEGTRNNQLTVKVLRGGVQEERFDKLAVDPDSPRDLTATLLSSSKLVQALPVPSQQAAPLPATTAVPVPFTQGASPGVPDYLAAIDALSGDTRLNLVLAATEPKRAAADVAAVHQALAAFAVTQADRGAPCIAFGSVTPDEQGDLAAMRSHAASVRSRRFVLVSPTGAAGAVAGVVARLDPKDSPTFKSVPLFGRPAARYRDSELDRLLGSDMNLCVVQDRPGRGVVVLRGLDTSGDQISVTRVADACIREVKAIAEGYIGELNSADARASLREQIVATFTRFEREGALVPSTDGKDPAFLVDVYSTQQDFAQGIVRVDIAVRPVRAIDFVYATIRVRN